MAAKISPLAPKSFPDVAPIAGVKLATGAAGIRYQGRTDVLLAVFDERTAVAGIFTRSKCPSAPVPDEKPSTLDSLIRSVFPKH